MKRFTVLISAVDMSIIRRAVLGCSNLGREFYRSILSEQSSHVVHRTHCVTSCHNMASSGVEFDTAENKDNARKSQEADEEVSAKRLKTSDSSLENDVGIFDLFVILFCQLWDVITIYIVTGTPYLSGTSHRLYR